MIESANISEDAGKMLSIDIIQNVTYLDFYLIQCVWVYLLTDPNNLLRVNEDVGAVQTLILWALSTSGTFLLPRPGKSIQTDKQLLREAEKTLVKKL